MEPKKLTLSQIHAMFKHGQAWLAVNSWLPTANGLRHVAQTFTKQIKWDRADKTTSWMDLPKASDVIEAYDGFLQFNIKRPGTNDILGTLTLTRQLAPCTHPPQWRQQNPNPTDLTVCKLCDAIVPNYTTLSPLVAPANHTNQNSAG